MQLKFKYYIMQLSFCDKKAIIFFQFETDVFCDTNQNYFTLFLNVNKL